MCGCLPQRVIIGIGFGISKAMATAVKNGQVLGSVWEAAVVVDSIIITITVHEAACMEWMTPKQRPLSYTCKLHCSCDNVTFCDDKFWNNCTGLSFTAK